MLRVMVAEWPSNQFFNLAFEEAVYRVSGGAVLRFWRNDRVVVIGRHQCAALEVEPRALRELGVKLVRRFTGGGAVYHDLGNVNYAITMPRGIAGVATVEDAFRLVTSVVAESLETLGVKGVKPGGLNDVEINGRKVSGLAATSSRDRVFVHGAMLVASDIRALWRVLRVTREKLSDKRFVESVVKRVITLEEALGRRVGVEEVYKALRDVVSERLRLEAVESRPTEAELREALRLYREKYSRWEWNLRYLGFASLSDEDKGILVEAATPSPGQEEVVRRVEAEVAASG